MCLNGERGNKSSITQEVRKVQQLLDAENTSEETKASKVNDLQEAEEQEPPCSSDKLSDNMLQ